MAAHKIILPLQRGGVLRGRGRAAVCRPAAGPQGRPQNVLLRPGPLPGRESAIHSYNAGTRAVSPRAEVKKSAAGRKLVALSLRQQPVPTQDLTLNTLRLRLP